MSSFLFGRFTSAPAPQTVPSGYRLISSVSYETLLSAAETAKPSNPELAAAIDAAAVSADNPPATAEPSKLDRLLEGLVGLIPLEGIAVWVIATEAFSNLTEVNVSEADQNALLTVSDPEAIKVAIAMAMVVAVISFLFGRREGDEGEKPKRLRERFKDLPLGATIIPPAAVFLWAYLVNPSVLRTAVGHPEPDTRWIVGVALGWILVIGAAYIGLTKKPAPASGQQ